VTDCSWGDTMKRVLRAFFLMGLGAVLVAAVHGHLREHKVPHPHAAKVFLAKGVVPQQLLPVAPATVAVLAAEQLMEFGFVATSGTVTLLETEPLSCCLRGPPLVRPLEVP
jgi:hypothetical protein